jgi:putative copper export protein
LASESLFEWSDLAFAYVGFVASFGMLGAVGFRYGVLPGRGRRGPLEGDIGAAPAYRRAAEGAAGIGLVGAVFGVVSFVEALRETADEKTWTLAEAFGRGGAETVAQALLLALLIVAFFQARRSSAVAWHVAGVSAVALALHRVFEARLSRLVNPLHVLGASLWIGTLFVLVVTGMRELARPSVPAETREPAVAELVSRFSTLALVSAALLGITGLTTAWTHLEPFSALWTTPYGYALLAKLLFVTIVVLLGAWNWRRVGPTLGREGGARAIRRSASMELAFAGVVLAITGLLVSLPSPK